MISIRKLFKQTFEGHEGREGQVGGSKPRAGGSAKGSKFNTIQKTGNALSKIVGKRISASSGQRGVLSTNVPIKKRASAERALSQMGFEKYQDPWHQDWVTSYKNGSIRVHLSTGENNDMEDIDGNKIFSITVSEQLERLPHIPYD